MFGCCWETRSWLLGGKARVASQPFAFEETSTDHSLSSYEVIDESRTTDASETKRFQAGSVGKTFQVEDLVEGNSPCGSLATPAQNTDDAAVEKTPNDDDDDEKSSPPPEIHPTSSSSSSSDDEDEEVDDKEAAVFVDSVSRGDEFNRKLWTSEKLAYEKAEKRNSEMSEKVLKENVELNEKMESLINRIELLEKEKNEEIDPLKKKLELSENQVLNLTEKLEEAENELKEKNEEFTDLFRKLGEMEGQRAVLDEKLELKEIQIEVLFSKAMGKESQFNCEALRWIFRISPQIVWSVLPLN